MTRTVSALAAAAVALTAAPAADRRPDLVGQTAPEFVGAADHWLSGPPATMAKLKGKVVWLQFHF